MITASLPRDDWRCSRCDYRGRASDRSCWKCGAPRGAAFGYIPPPSAPTGGGVVPVTNKAVDGARRPAGTMRAGDKRDGEDAKYSDRCPAAAHGPGVEVCDSDLCLSSDITHDTERVEIHRKS